MQCWEGLVQMKLGLIKLWPEMTSNGGKPACKWEDGETRAIYQLTEAWIDKQRGHRERILSWTQNKLRAGEENRTEKCITEFLLLVEGKAEKAVYFLYGTTLKW